MSVGIELERHANRGSGRIGGSDFNHNPDPKDEAEYQELRKAAAREYEQRRDCMRRAHEAYERGDGAEAKQLSNEGKKHGVNGEEFDEQASKYILERNNRNIDGDTLDLHGQYVDEAVSILAKRIQKAQKDGRTHLHVIVGKGNHSAGHVQKLKPAVEDFCRDLGLQYRTEENAGRVYVNLQGDEVTHMPPLPPHPAPQHAGYGEQPYGSYPSQHQQPQHGGQNQQEQQYDELEMFFTKLVKKYCCTVM
ncbi:putative smr domain-containing protein [Rosellinia necatrix]|uniref:Putative smr domain-containing protein n=1 Tax=Rosellinia necatrix TaxID=77044 RepID=A0A1W2TI22_ROSNE|nr:putative smr domain-containing protein [Rosellinia necatrix]